MARRRFTPLRKRIAADHPEASDVDALIEAGRVMVDGRFVTNPDSTVATDSSVVLVPMGDLRGETKLGYALDRCGVPVGGAIAVDVGASAGGFTQAMLLRGASRVYAVDAGHGQLLGSLRQDPRVVNLEATNVSGLSLQLIPDVVQLVSIDVSYLPLREAVIQLGGLEFDSDAHLVGLVKPMFELGLGELPVDERSFDEAISLAESGIEAAGWEVRDRFRSTVLGSRGAVEFFVHATRRQDEG